MQTNPEDASPDTSGGEAGAGARLDLAADLRALGENLRDALRAAWTSQERERFQAEVEQGLKALGEALGQTFEAPARERASQRVRETVGEARRKAAGAREELRSRPVGERVRGEIHELLTRLDEQVRRSKQHWTPRGADAAAEPPQDAGRPSPDP